MGERFEWVEIIEPSRHEHMFANLKTGQCLWDPPDGVAVKPTHENQWWELFDTNTRRYYYYNATSQETVWRKPKDGDIIPLSKLQMLKSRETSTRHPSSNSKKIKHADNFENNNVDNMKHDSRKFNERKVSGHSKEDELINNNTEDTAVIQNQGIIPYLKNENSESSHIEPSMNKTIAQVSLEHTSASNVSAELNGKLPRTMTVGLHHDRPPVKEKPKYHSLRSKAPPKPPRSAVNIMNSTVDPHSQNTVNISVSIEKTVNDNDGKLQKENVAPMSPPQFDISVTKGKVTTQVINQSIASAPIAIVPPTAGDKSSQDTILMITTQNSIREDKSSPLSIVEISPSTSKQHQGEYSSPLDVISERESTFSSFAPKEQIIINSSRSSRISQSIEYAAPLKINTLQSSIIPNSMVTQVEYAAPQKNISKTDEHSRSPSAQSSEYASPVPIIYSPVQSASDYPATYDGGDVSSPNNSPTHNSHTDLIISPKSTVTLVYQTIDEDKTLSNENKSSGGLSSHDYALINEIDSINEKDTAGPIPPPPPIFPVNAVPVAPPPLKVTPRRQLPSMYDNVDPTTMAMYENSSEDLDDTFNSADLSTSPRVCNMSGSSDEAFDPSSSNLLESESPDGNYYDRIENGIERRSCATLPSPRSSPRKLPKTPGNDERGTPPAKRNPLVRMKSDPLVDVEKRAKISKTIESIQSTFRPVSMLNLSNNIANMTHKHKRSVLGSESDIPEQVPLSTHRTGILRRRMSIHSILSWSKTCIKKPMVLTRDKSLRKDAVDVFKLILMCMGDKSTRKGHDTCRVDIVTKGWNTSQLRDEIYIQLCKQTTSNKRMNSLKQGWELITACLSIFPPSNKFKSYLEGYIYRHLECDDELSIQANVPKYAKYCYKQLERICQTGAKRGLKGPTIEEIQAAIKRVFNPSMFSNTLEDIMEMQKEKYPDLRLPWILTTLTEAVLLQNGLQTEGIFRIPGDIDDVNALKLHIDNWQVPQVDIEPTCSASLLKLWFRDLFEPLIPQRFYDQCIHNCDNPDISLNIVNSLPPINNVVFSYLIRLLQAFIIPENVMKTKMDENNLSMVWAPNCLRCPSEDPREIFENTRKEMTFLRTVIKVLDTSFLEGVV